MGNEVKNQRIIESLNNLKPSELLTLSIPKSALDTLVFFSFGITLDDDCDRILNSLIDKAYKDATLMGAFNTYTQEVLNQDDIYEAKKAGTELLVEWLKELPKTKFSDRDWQSKLCNKLIDCYKAKEIDYFSKGNAQKWVNMTLKYVYLLSNFTDTVPKNEETAGFKSICRVVKEYSYGLHVPIDSYILDALVFIGIIDDDSRIDGKLPLAEYNRPSEHLPGWSKIGEDECKLKYEDIQNSIGEKTTNKNMSRIEWEEQAWIEIAKWRKRDT